MSVVQSKSYYELSGNKGQINGYAPLNAQGQIPLSVLPLPITATEVDTTIVVTSEVGQANGVASLDSSGKVPISQVPISAISQQIAEGIGFMQEVGTEIAEDRLVDSAEAALTVAEFLT